MGWEQVIALGWSLQRKVKSLWHHQGRGPAAENLRPGMFSHQFLLGQGKRCPSGEGDCMRGEEGCDLRQGKLRQEQAEGL